MIEPVGRAIQRANIYYFVFFAILIGMSILCFSMAKRKESMILYGIALVVVTIISFATSFLPYFTDLTNSSISVTECVYVNSVGDKSKTPSSIMGIYSVKLLANDKTLAVSTLPLSKSNFPVGEYLVRAYYTTNSKRLIYIEMIEENNEAVFEWKYWS